MAEVAQSLLDIVGREYALSPAEKRKVHGGKHKAPIPRGYAFPPGTGPEGETCKTCAHIVRKHLSKTYLKCGKAEYKWTGGGASDIRAGSKACKAWEAKNRDAG